MSDDISLGSLSSVSGASSSLVDISTPRFLEVPETEDAVISLDGSSRKRYVLYENKLYSYQEISFKNIEISGGMKGIYILKSKNDIIIENTRIYLMGFSYDSYLMDPFDESMISDSNVRELYGNELNCTFVGKSEIRGNSCSCSKYGGGSGIKIECNKLIMNKSEINISGCGANHSWGCGANHSWCCDGGSGGSCLIICNQLIMDKESKILAKGAFIHRLRSSENEYHKKYTIKYQKYLITHLKSDGRIVMQINQNCFKLKNVKLLIYGFVRNIKNSKIINDLLNIIIGYYYINYSEYLIKPEPIFVTKEYQKIEF